MRGIFWVVEDLLAFQEGLCSLEVVSYSVTYETESFSGKLTGPQVVNEFPSFYGNRSSITAFTTARHLFLFWARLIHSMPAHPTWRSTLIIIYLSTWNKVLLVCVPEGPWLVVSEFLPVCSASHIRRRYCSWVPPRGPEISWRNNRQTVRAD